MRADAPADDRAAASSLGGLFRRAGYTSDGIRIRLGTEGDVLSRSLDRPVHVRRLTDDAPLDLLIRLFLLGLPVEAETAERALGAGSLEGLAALRAVALRGGEAVPLLQIVPHGDIVLASDLPDREGAHADHVAGLHRPSVTLADLTVRTPVRRALDVGTGSGIQALLAARHSERVVATDVNERALAFAALNAALNGVENVEFRRGTFFEPARGERFDLVVCNPPYVVSPESAYLFRDSGLGRDRVSERLVAELPGALAEGGFGSIMVSWIPGAEDPFARPREWLTGTECDAWVFHTAVEDALETAAAWNRDEAHDEQAYGDAIDRWLDYFGAEGIESLAYGAVVLRRRSGGDNWIRMRELPSGSRSRSDEHLLRLFTAQDFARARTDAELLRERVALVDGAVISTRTRRDGDGWSEEAELGLTVGIPFGAELDRFTAELIAQLDGGRSAGDVLHALARTHGADPDAVVGAGPRLVRDLLELGFVVPVGHVDAGA